MSNATRDLIVALVVFSLMSVIVYGYRGGFDLPRLPHNQRTVQPVQGDV